MYDLLSERGIDVSTDVGDPGRNVSHALMRTQVAARCLLRALLSSWDEERVSLEGAYKAGRAASLAHEGEDSNPYRIDTRWAEGWSDAEGDQDEEAFIEANYGEET